MEKVVFTHKQEIRFVDIDVMGHVNNAVYFNYFEQARINWFAQLIGKWDWEKAGILLARNEINYRQPVLLNEEVFIDTWIEEVGTKSLTMCYIVYTLKEGEKQIKADAKSVLVCFDYHAKKTILVPEFWTNKLK